MVCGCNASTVFYRHTVLVQTAGETAYVSAHRDLRAARSSKCSARVIGTARVRVSYSGKQLIVSTGTSKQQRRLASTWYI